MEATDEWEYRLGQLVANALGDGFCILDGPPGSCATRLVYVDRFKSEGWVIVRELPGVTLYNEIGLRIRGRSPALLLKRRKA